MNKYNIMPKEAFESLTKKDPKFILQYMMEFAEASRQNPDLTLVVPFSSIPKNPIKITDAVVKDFGWLFAGQGQCRARALSTDEEMLKKMNTYTTGINLSYDGYVIAGSSVITACLGKKPVYGDYVPHDIDLFPFYDPMEIAYVPIQDQVMTIYKRFLREINEACMTIKNRNDDKTTMLTRRTEFCTTIWSIHFNVDEIQIIHRAFSSPVATVVGFDQMACKAFFDGEMAYFTIDAALCLYFGINPIDWRRESPSHLRRAKKYVNYGFLPIFPGLPFSVGEQIMQQYDNMNTRKSYKLPGSYLIPNPRNYNRIDTESEQICLKLVSENDIRKDDPNIINKEDHEVMLDRPLNRQHNLTGGGENESDYDMEGSYVHEHLAYAYRGLAELIKGKTNFIPVFSKIPIDILDNCTIIPIRHILEKVYPGDFSQFYFGDRRIYDTYLALVHMRLKAHGRTHVSFKLLKGQNKERAIELENNLEELIDKRVEELEDKANQHLTTMKGQVRFITTNPGAQFTSSFHPIIRRNAREYWGSLYQKYDCSDYNKIKLTILLIKRFRSSVWDKMDKDVIKIIFKHLYSYHFIHLTSSADMVITKEHNDICCHRLIPWISNEECICQAGVKKMNETIKLARKMFYKRDNNTTNEQIEETENAVNESLDGLSIDLSSLIKDLIVDVIVDYDEEDGDNED
jgi:hypothetical protein